MMMNPFSLRIWWSPHSQQKPAPTKYSKSAMIRRSPRHMPPLLTLARSLMLSLKTKNQSLWTLKTSCCGGIITSSTCPLTALSNWEPRGSSPNDCLPVTHPSVPLVNTARCQKDPGRARKMTKVRPRQPHIQDKLCQWTCWSLRPQVSLPNWMEHSRNNNTSTRPFLLTNTHDIHLYTCKNALQAKKQ